MYKLEMLLFKCYNTNDVALLGNKYRYNYEQVYYIYNLIKKHIPLIRIHDNNYAL